MWQRGGVTRQAKPGSKPYRGQLRDRLAGLGFAEDVIHAKVAENLMTECGIRPRTAWRLAAELSLDGAAVRYNAITRDPRAGMRGSRIWEFEQWPERGVRPTLPALRVLAQAYGTTWRSLLELRDLEQLPAKELAEYHADVPPPAAAPPPLDAGTNMLADAMALTTTNVDDVQLDDLWSDVTFLGNAYTRTAPASVLRQLSLVQQRVATLLKGRQRPAQTRDLYLINAKCCAMMAWISGDLGRYDRARELSSTAWLYAQYVDDHLARRWVRTAQCRVAFWAGNGVESAQFAVDGLRYRVGRQLTEAPLVLSEARGWSSVGAEPQVRDAIARWARVEDSDLEVVSEDRFFNITKDRRHYVAGSALLAVGRTAEALGEFETARQAFGALAREQRWAAMAPMMRIDIGRCHVRLGDLDAAAAEVAPLLSTEVGPQPDMVRAMLRRLTDDLAEPRWRTSATARELLDALSGVTASIG
jgi:hypothetical protein